MILKLLSNCAVYIANCFPSLFTDDLEIDKSELTLGKELRTGEFAVSQNCQFHYLPLLRRPTLG